MQRYEEFNSKDLPAAKLAKVGEAVPHKAEANTRAGRHADNIYDAVQHVFNANDTELSAQKFTPDHDINSSFRRGF